VKAIVFRRHGGPDVLELTDLPDPTPGPGEVVVRVEACALNHLDLWVRGGLPGLKLPLPHVGGSDVAGVVEAVGPGVTGAAPGDPVVLQPGVSCGRCRECLAGRDNFCRDYQILGEHRFGGCAEKVVVPAANLLPRPPGMPPAEAAAFPLTMLTAWQMLVSRARVQPGETVLVLGAGAGVATAGVQIAKLFGARVIAASTSDEKLARARQLGADDVINVTTQDLVGQVRALTGKRGADVVFEHVGKALWDKAILACARGGRLVTCGATSGFDAATDLRHVFFRQISILGSTMGSKGDLWQILDHVRAGKLRPVVDRVLPLAEARQAHEILESGGQFGKVVLTPTSP
jgi:NADPH:quinone reductase-like Zn-dependent oxidoreductase